MIRSSLHRLAGLVLVRRGWVSITGLNIKLRKPDISPTEKIKILISLEHLNPVSENEKKMKEDMRGLTMNELARILSSLNDSDALSLLIYVTKLQDKQYLYIIETLFMRVAETNYEKWSQYEVYYFVAASNLLNKHNPKQRRFLHRIVDVIDFHIDRLDLNFIMSFMVFFDKVMGKRIAPNEKVKYKQLFNKIEKRALSIMTSDQISQFDRKIMQSPQFYLHFLSMGHLTSFLCKPLYELIEKRALELVKNASNVSEQFKFWLVFYNRLGAFGLGGDEMLDWALQHYHKNSKFRQQADQYNPTYLNKMCYSYLTINIVREYTSLKLLQEKGSQVLRKSKYVMPKFQLHPFLILFKDKFEPDVVYRQLQLFFPEHLTKPCDSSHNLMVYTNNEFRLAVRKELQRLQLKFVEEEVVIGRRFDFMVNEDLIIEVDGDFHYDAETGKENSGTMVRNFVFLKSGKRLLIIKLVDYHFARQRDQFTEVFRHKLSQIMNDKDIIFSK